MQWLRIRPFHIRKFATATLMLTGFSLLLLSAGCSDGRGTRVPISGTVTIDGEPLKHGSVTFFPIASGDGYRAGGGSLDENGQYRISSYTAFDGLLPGKYEVTILAVEPINDESQRWHAPKSYSSAATSGLTIEIKDESVMDLELSWTKDESHSAPYVEKF